MNEALKFRRARSADAARIVEIIRQAQAQMRAQGSLQWQNGYPAPADIRRDIERGYGYVLEKSGAAEANETAAGNGTEAGDGKADGDGKGAEDETAAESGITPGGETADGNGTADGDGTADGSGMADGSETAEETGMADGNGTADGSGTADGNGTAAGDGTATGAGTETGTVIAYGAVVFDGEPAYDAIEGAWVTGGEYVVLHRLAVADGEKGRGVAAEFMRRTETLARRRGVGSFRVDTNFDNRYMLRLLERLGFVYCGKIVYQSGERLAFEKHLEA